MEMRLAFCFLIYDEILNEELWYKFFKNVNPSKYSIYIHYKSYKPLKYFESYRISECRLVDTKWGDISLVKAHRMLFEEAYINTLNYKFINVSQSCIPLKNFDYIYKVLTSNGNSLLTECPQEACLPRCRSLLSHFPKEKIFKSTQWFILNRSHVNVVLQNYTKEEMFKNVSCPEEHYFITLIKNYKNEMVEYLLESENEGTTFTNWDESESEDSPKTYTTISSSELASLISSRFLFGRKFAKNCKVTSSLDMYIL